MIGVVVKTVCITDTEWALVEESWIATQMKTGAIAKMNISTEKGSMMKKQKKKCLAKIIVLGLGKLIIAMVCALLIITMFALAYLQESYRLNPPSQAERAENPALIDFLIGSDSEADESIPSDARLPHSPLLRIEGWRKPNELCRVATLLTWRRGR